MCTGLRVDLEWGTIHYCFKSFLFLKEEKKFSHFYIFNQKLKQTLMFKMRKEKIGVKVDDGSGGGSDGGGGTGEYYLKSY